MPYYGSDYDESSMGLPGTLGYMGLQSASFNLSTMTSGFYGGKPSSMSSLGRYMVGKTPDIGVARKLAGRTWAGAQYSKVADKIPGLSNLAPSLSHLLPSRYLTYWSILAGSESALQGGAAMSAISGAMKRVPAGSGGFGHVSKYLFGSKEMGAYNYRGPHMREPFFEQLVSGDSYLKWGEVMEGEGSKLSRLRALQSKAMQGDTKAAMALGRQMGIIGKDAGAVSNAIGKFLAKGAGSTLMTNVGKSIPFLARGVAMGTVGFDLYSIMSLAGTGLGKIATKTLNAQGNAYNRLTSDIHRGSFMSTSPLSPFVGQTGRQRAMANIYEKQLNMRSVLGNEAPYLANRFL